MARPESYKPMPANERLHQLLEYNADTGVLKWRERDASSFAATDGRSPAGNANHWNSMRAGKAAGCRHKVTGYVTVDVDQVKLKAHRLIWAMMTGEAPDVVDHINGDRADNRWANLRNASAQVNAKNKRLYANNSSGMMGVSFHKRDKVWQVKINAAPGEEVHLGSYDTRAEAVAARIAGEILLSYHANHGASDRAQYQEPPRNTRMN